jgi:hypothetical protein
MKKIDFRQLKKGIECILLPDYFPETMPQKVYFMFITETFEKKDTGFFSYAKIIFAKDLTETTKYENLEDFRSKQSKVGIDKDNIVFISDIDRILIFSSAQFSRYNKLYSFIFEKKEAFNKALKWFYPLGEIKDIINSDYFYKIRKNPYLGKLIFRNTIAWMYTYGLLKYIVKYPFIFIFDLFKLTFDRYINYKKKFVDLDSRETKHIDFMARCMGTNEEELEKSKILREDAFETAKKEYLNSNVALLTLLLSILIFFIPQVIGSFNKKNIESLQNKIEIISTEYKKIQEDILSITKVLLEKDLEIKALQVRNDTNEQIIELYRKNELIIDSFKKTEGLLDEIVVRIKAIEKGE